MPGEALPALSVALAVIECVPSASCWSPATVNFQVPALFVVTWRRRFWPSSTLTVEPASAEPVKVGVGSLVTLSVSEEPVSLSAARSGRDGVEMPRVDRKGVRRGIASVPGRVPGPHPEVVLAIGLRSVFLG